MSDKLVHKTSCFLAGHTSRRGFLARVALAGSALTVAPLQFLLRPQSAWATITPYNCSSGRCTDGFTEFCCTLNAGGAARNVCPYYSYVAGWWKACDYYSGPYMCAYGPRYFIDCNRRNAYSCTGQCAGDRCDYRRTCWNVFRYGNCHTNVGGTTEVVCRLISCIPPWHYTGGCFACNSTYMADTNTCGHEASCRCGQCADAYNTYVGSCGDSCSGCTCC